MNILQLLILKSRVIAQWEGPLPYTQLTQVHFLAPHRVPQAPSGVIPGCKVRSNPLSTASNVPHIPKKKKILDFFFSGLEQKWYVLRIKDLNNNPLHTCLGVTSCWVLVGDRSSLFSLTVPTSSCNLLPVPHIRGCDVEDQVLTLLIVSKLQKWHPKDKS